MSFVYFIDWVSGVGKTTVVNTLKSENLEKKILFLNFDDIWVPSFEEMVEQYGSGEKWQEAMTYKWIEKILSEYQNYEIVVLEWQVNLEFIRKWFAKFSFDNYRIILVTCSEQEIYNRLNQRNQLELANENMYNWQRFLINQANEFGVDIVDTTDLSEQQVSNYFKNILQQ